VIAAGVGAIAMRVPAIGNLSGAELAAVAGIALATIVAERFPVQIDHDGEREDFSCADAVWVAALALAAPAALTLAVVLGVGVGQALRRVAPLKIAFNVANYAVAITAAEALAAAVRSDGGFGSAAAVGVTLGMVAFLVVNTLLVAMVISFVAGEPFRRTLVGPAIPGVLQWACSVALGLLGALLWTQGAWAVPVLLLLLGLSYVACRGLVGRIPAAVPVTVASGGRGGSARAA
jgi:hypothetical protein